MPARATVLVMPPWGERAALSARLGPERAGSLSELLLQRALAAAQAAAPGSVHRASGGGSGPQDLAAAVEPVWPGPAPDDPGPLLILWPDLPVWRPVHLDAALSDFADGCELVIGPLFDGGLYLLGLARPLPALWELEDEAWTSPTAMATTLAVAARGEIVTGLLRPERPLRTAEDVAAALADPLLDAELRGLLL